MVKLVPHPDKVDGVCYVFSQTGLELPVLDLGHPAFAINLDEAQQRALLEQAGRENARFLGWRGLPLRIVAGFLLRRSVIGRGLAAAQGGYLDGLSTYLMKLGEPNLGPWATPLDRRLCASYPALNLRLRVQAVAELQAQALRPLLQARPGAELHLFNLAGGPASDSLNTLRLLRRDAPGLLDGRRVRVHVLDLESEGPGPRFAEAALRAWLEPGAPLAGLDAELRREPYDWTRPEALAALLGGLPPEAVSAVTSEGGLFDYGADAVVAGNLRALAALPAGTPLSASYAVPAQAQRRLRVAETLSRGDAEVDALLAAAGWAPRERRERPMHTVFLAQRA